MSTQLEYMLLQSYKWVDQTVILLLPIVSDLQPWIKIRCGPVSNTSENPCCKSYTGLVKQSTSTATFRLLSFFLLQFIFLTLHIKWFEHALPSSWHTVDSFPIERHSTSPVFAHVPTTTADGHQTHPLECLAQGNLHYSCVNKKGVDHSLNRRNHKPDCAFLHYN